MLEKVHAGMCLIILPIKKKAGRDGENPRHPAVHSIKAVVTSLIVTSTLPVPIQTGMIFIKNPQTQTFIFPL